MLVTPLAPQYRAAVAVASSMGGPPPTSSSSSSSTAAAAAAAASNGSTGGGGGQHGSPVLPEVFSYSQGDGFGDGLHAYGFGAGFEVRVCGLYGLYGLILAATTDSICSFFLFLF